MSMLDTPWVRFRRFVGPVTRRVPYGHVMSESAVYARLLAPTVLHPRTRFVIFAQGRSGSTLLADLLNCHPQIFCADEPLTWPRRDPARYAAACGVGHRGDTYGFKVKIYQLSEAQRLDPAWFLQRLHRDGWHIIHLQRRNVLRQALSSLVAGQRRMYHQLDGDRPRPVHVDPATLLRDTAARERFGDQEAAALVGLPHLMLVYEDDLLDPACHQATASRVFSRLGLDDVPVTTRLHKIGDRSLAGTVANAEEVRAAVDASPYADLLQQE